MENLKCTNCGSKLKQNANGIFVCISCGSEFRDDKNDLQISQYLTNGNVSLTNNDFSTAKENFENANKLCYTNPYSWLGMIKCYTNNLKELSIDNLSKVKQYLTNLKRYSTKDDLNHICEEIKICENLISNANSMEIRNNHSSLYFKFALTIGVAIFVALFIVNLVYTINSTIEVFWKIFDFIIMCVMEVIAYFLSSFLIGLFIPKHKWQYFVYSSLYVIYFALIIFADIMCAIQL